MGNTRLIKSDSYSTISGSLKSGGPLIMLPVPAHEGSPNYQPPVPHPPLINTSLQSQTLQNQSTNTNGLMILRDHYNNLYENGNFNRGNGNSNETGIQTSSTEPSLSALSFAILLGRLESARRIFSEMTTETTPENPRLNDRNQQDRNRDRESYRERLNNYYSSTGLSNDLNVYIRDADAPLQHGFGVLDEHDLGNIGTDRVRMRIIGRHIRPETYHQTSNPYQYETSQSEPLSAVSSLPRSQVILQQIMQYQRLVNNDDDDDDDDGSGGGSHGVDETGINFNDEEVNITSPGSNFFNR